MPAGYVAKMADQQAAGTLFNTYTTAKTVINPQALWAVPGGWFQRAGQQVLVTARGGLSNIVTTPGLIVFQVMMGANIVFTTGNIQLNATAHTLLPFKFEALLTLQLVGDGTVAKFMGMGTVNGVQFTRTAAQTDGANTETIINVPITAPAQGAGFNSTIANVFDFFVGFTISNAGNGIQIAQYSVLDLG